MHLIKVDKGSQLRKNHADLRVYLPSLIFFLGDPLPLLVGVATSGVPPFLLLDLLIN